MSRQVYGNEAPSSRIAVVGVGGGGGNALNRMIESAFEGVDFIAINTDLQDLRKSKARFRIQIGEKLTQGLGAGANPEIGQRAAEESRNIIKEYLKEANLVIITAGMGKGTGTGASPVVASIAKEMGKLVVAVVTKPFYLEGRHRIVNADIGIENLSKVADAYIVVANENLVALSNNATMSEAFEYADGVLRQCILGISDVIINTQTLNIDFADLRTVLKDMGRAYLGIGSGSGTDRVINAVKSAVNIRLQDIRINNATSVMLYVKAKHEVTVEEIDKAAVLVREAVHKDANIIFGFDFRDDLPHDVEIMLIATGFGDEKRGERREARPETGLAPTRTETPVEPRPQSAPSTAADGGNIARTIIHPVDDEDDDDVAPWLKEKRNRSRNTFGDDKH